MSQSQQGHVHGPNCSHQHGMHDMTQMPQMVNDPYQGHVHGPNCNHDHNDIEGGGYHHQGISGMQQMIQQGMAGISNQYQDHVHGPNCNHGPHGIGAMTGMSGMSGMGGMTGMMNPYSMQRMGGYNPMRFHFREYQKPQITQEERQQLKKQETLEDEDFIYVSYSGIFYIIFNEKTSKKINK